MTTPECHVLLLEDDPRDAELIIRALQRGSERYAVTVARSRKDLEPLLGRPFDAIVADYRLPDLEATSAIEEVRRHLPDAPFVVVSGSTTEDQLLTMLRIGADDYLLKDRLARLAAAVGAARERHRLRRERAQAEALAGQRELELRHLQRVESIGLLTGGIAHDFNNLLTVVLGSADLALPLIDPASQAHALIREVLGAGRRAAGLTQQLLSFARRRTAGTQTLDMNIVVGEFLGMTRTALGHGIEVTFTPTTTPPPRVVVDRVQLEQVLMNLLLNARDAMPDGGTIHLGLQVDASAPRQVHLTVRDSGAGMTPEVQARMFEPFFTTKPAGIGTGLGLPTSLAIVRQSGGDLRVTSQPGLGTTFTVSLPLATPRLAAPPAVLRAPGGGGRTILVVEPDQQLLGTLRTMLHQGGHDVVAVARTEDIAAAFGDGTQPIDLVIAEAEEAGAIGDSLRVAGCRAGGPPMLLLRDPDAAPPAAGVHGLQKPFTQHELLASVRGVP